MEPFRALVARKADDGLQLAWEQLTDADLMEGDVTVRISHTTINYKDGLALTGSAPIIRRWPLIPGIDFAGTVEASSHADFKPGDNVILNGWGVGEGHHGGYSQIARVSGDWLVKRPDAFSAAQTMALGTAGYTAMLCVMALQAGGVTPDDGPILVTGAAGGVGSVAVSLLAKLGYHVVAATGRVEEAEFLKKLGAAEIVDRADFSERMRPLEKEKWAGAVDVAGSTMLANIIAQMKYGGTVAACGLAQGMDLKTTVMPFILRNVTLAGVDSVMAPKAKREEAWARLARDVNPAILDDITVTKPLESVIELAPEILAGKVRGRVVFEVN